MRTSRLSNLIRFLTLSSSVFVASSLPRERTENGKWKIEDSPVHTVTLAAILYSLSSILGPVRAEQIPSHVVCVPVRAARSLAFHPNKPLLYVGLAGRTNGMNLATFEIDKNGKLLAETRRQHADGLVEGGVPAGCEYAVSAIAFNPTLPQVYLSATPERIGSYRLNTNAS